MTGQVAAVAFVVGCLVLQGAGARSVGGEAPGGSPRTVRDGAGREVKVPAAPQRIVSLAPSVTEILFAVGAGDRVVGVTDFCDHPAEAATRTRVGGLIHPDLERIASLRPDLAIATTAGNYLEDTERIERLGIPVYTLSASTVDGIIGTIVEVGGLVGTSAEAGRLAAGLRDRVRRVREAAALPRPRVLFVIEPQPLIVPGPDTFVGEAVRLAGADLVSTGSTSGWNQVDFEQVVSLAPEVILATQAHAAWARALPDAAEWRLIPAARDRSVFVISDAIQHPGPRLVDGMEEVAGIVAGWRERRGGLRRMGLGLPPGHILPRHPAAANPPRRGAPPPHEPLGPDAAPLGHTGS